MALFGIAAYWSVKKGVFYGCVFAVTELYAALSFLEHVCTGLRAQWLLLSYRIATLLLLRLPLFVFISAQAAARASRLVCKLGCAPLAALDAYWLSLHLKHARRLWRGNPGRGGSSYS